ncbi:MAG: Gfo/Idh/MocA family oxidoreductase [Planctomycetota bacterium]
MTANPSSTAKSPPPVRVGLVGLGGYARGLISVIRAGAPDTVLAAACDVAPDQHPDAVRELEAEGAQVFTGLDAMLDAHRRGDTPLDAAWLPVPIHLHQPFTEQCLDAGLAVMVEKPAAGSLAEVDAMRSVRDRTGLPVLVGFQDMYFPESYDAKRRLLDGAIGRVQRVGLFASWPRTSAYYGRNAWAGKVRHGDDWVCDSPLNNALSHPVHLALFMVGPSLHKGAKVVGLDAELYRANPIESFDTCSVRLRTDTDVDITVCFTHACADNLGPITTYHGEDGTLVATHGDLRFKINDRSATDIIIQRDMAGLPRRLAAAVRGAETQASPCATLETAREHTAVVEALHGSVAIHSVPDASIRVVSRDDANLRTLPGIEAALQTCSEQGRLLSELHDGEHAMPWAQPGTHGVQLV